MVLGCDVWYYYSDTTKNVLVASTYIHLKCNGIGKYASDFSSLCPRILLSGPSGNSIVLIYASIWPFYTVEVIELYLVLA